MPHSLAQLPWRNDFAELGTGFYTSVTPEPLHNPRLVAWDTATATRIGYTEEADQLLPFLAGTKPLPGSQPLSMVYSGHQFGQYAGQLGDGRGVLLGDLKTGEHFWDIHLKGAGRTPYSRSGDGRAVLRSCIREYLASIALDGLQVPTSHALCVLTSDEKVAREQWEPRASLVRVAQTHIRFGSFEHFFHNRQDENLRRLAEFVIERFLPGASGQQDRYEQLFALAVRNTAAMIAKWQAVGFAHGVMNTDNMSIIGETFDYGPYGFMETYDPSLICNHSDHQGRYAFEMQPEIGFWNLQALAQAFSTLVTTDRLIHQLRTYRHIFSDHYAAEMRRKFGLLTAEPEDKHLTATWLGLLQKAKLDYQRSFRLLAEIDYADGTQKVIDQFSPAGLIAEAESWLQTFATRRGGETLATESFSQQSQQALRLGANPVYVLRNYLAQNAIAAATQGDYAEVGRLAELLRKPFDEQAGAESYTEPAPAWAQDLAVSCSS